MKPPEPTSAALAVPARPGLGLPTGGLPWWLLVVVASLVTARLTMLSVQLGCTVALVVLVAGLYVANRTAGLAAVWLVWILTPFVRRVFFLSDPIETADPLALAPFLVTAVVVAFELTQVELSRRSRRLLVLVAAGYAIGVPLGVLKSPPAAAFALFAYITAAGCFLIGYRDGDGERRQVLPSVLLVAMPFVALYALRQYYFDPLPEWDAVWLETADINSAGSPDGSRVRVWGTLNSPGTFAVVLGVTAAIFVARERMSPERLAGALTVLGALALTYVRSAWLGLVVAILVVLTVTRGAALRRVAPLLLVMVALGPLVIGGSVGAALGDRATSIATPGEDESAQERVATPTRLVPSALTLPLGRGVGQAGEATRLAGGGFRYTDNGYLSLLFQVGPFGFLLVMAAIVAIARTAWRNAWNLPETADVVTLGVLSFMLVTMLAGDQLYGVGGMIFWYVSGFAVRRGEVGGGGPA